MSIAGSAATMISWHDTADAMLSPFRLVRALFVRPSPEGIESVGDLVYEYGQALLHTPSIFRRLAFKTRTLEEELQEAMLRGNLRRSLGRFDLLMLGLGVVIGTGVFSLTGVAQARFAGSATFLSYLSTGLVMLCSAACYGELCVQYPIAGSAFTYIMVTFGELCAFLTFGMLFIEYVVGMAAVARGFSNYLGLLLPGIIGSDLLIETENHQFDFVAFGIVLIISLLLSLGAREFSSFQSVLTLLKIFLMLFIVIAAFTKADPSNFADYFAEVKDPPLESFFQAAAFLVFTYVTFDAVCNAVEEAREPSDIPPALLWTVGVACFLYMLMAVASALLISPQQLWLCSDENFLISSSQCTNPEALSQINVKELNQDIPNSPSGNGYCPGTYNETGNELGPYGWSYAPFNFAFSCRGMVWMQYIVSLAALFGTVSSLLVGLYSVARLIMSVAREWLLPPHLARIALRTGTPILAQLTVGIAVGILALIFPVDELAELASFGAILGMILVANAVLFHRYYPEIKFRFTNYGTVEAVDSLSGSRTFSGNAPSSRSGSGVSHAETAENKRKKSSELPSVILQNCSDAVEAQYDVIVEDPEEAISPCWNCRFNAFKYFVSLRNQFSKETQQRLVWFLMSLINIFAWISFLTYRIRLRHAGDYNISTRPHLALVGIDSDSWFLLPLLLSALSLCALALLCPINYLPTSWSIDQRLMPWVPGLTVLVQTMFLAAFDFRTIKVALIFIGGILCVYILFSMPMSYIRRFKLGTGSADEYE